MKSPALKETIDICADELFRGKNTLNGGLDRPAFVQLMELATCSVEFSFDGVMYQQVDGVAMGSPLGPTLANIFLGFYEETALADVNGPMFYCRYVDDTFAVFENEAQSDVFKNKLNNLHQALKFTSEKETDNKLNFLDVCVSKIDGIISTDVYRKPSFNGLSMKWNSFCPPSMKIKLITTLTHRAINICSPDKLQAEIEKLKNLFLDNGFPGALVHSTISRKLDQANLPVQFGPEKRTVVVQLPYIGKPSHLYARRIATAVEQCYNGVTVASVFTTQKVPVRSLKEKLPTTANSNIIYQFECHCGSGYVGKTSQILKKRIGQHVPPIFRSISGKCKLPTKHSSAIGQHLIENPECAAQYNDGRFSILARARNFYKLSILEAIFIRLRKPILCKQKKFVLSLKLLVAL